MELLTTLYGLVALHGSEFIPAIRADASWCVRRPGNEEEAGLEAEAGQFMAPLMSARGGCMDAEQWDMTEAPDTLDLVQARNTAAQSKTQTRRVRITGGSAATGSRVDLDELKRLTMDNRLGEHRQLVMAGGCGGWCAGTRALPRVTTGAVVEWVQEIAEVCEANTDAPVIRADLKDVQGTALAVAPFGPFNSAEISSPCTDFSPSGKGIEGERAWVTVTSTLVAMRLHVPLIFYENVPRMLKSQAWALTASLLEDAGYLWRAVVVNAADCGVAQDRRRVFVAAVRRGLGAASQLKRWQMLLEQLHDFPSASRTTVHDVAPRLGQFYWFNARSTTAACIRSMNTRSPTQRTNCGYTPGRVLEEHKGDWMGKWKYRARAADEATIEKASSPTIQQLARIGGFDPDFLWCESRKWAARMIGNSVAPPVATQVMLAAQRAGLLRTHWRERPALVKAMDINLLRESQRLVGTVKHTPAWNKMPMWSDAQWKEAAETTRLAAARARRRARPGTYMKPRHPKALWPPRRAQSGWLAEFRQGCRARGLHVPSAADEVGQGLGVQGAVPDVKGQRALITPDSSLKLLVDARRRIRNLADNIENGETHTDVALCGIWRPIAGWPNANVEAWEASGAAKTQLDWLRKGHRFRFTRPPAPVGCGGTPDGFNHIGAQQHSDYLLKVWAEYIVLGMVSESPTIPASLGQLNVIPKGNYDAEDPKLKNRLRILLDERPLNLDLETTRFSAETLQRARHIIEEGDVTLEFDFSAYFLHFLASQRDRQFMGCTLGTDGPLGGRWWVWNVAPMGVALLATRPSLTYGFSCGSTDDWASGVCHTPTTPTSSARGARRR